MAFSSSLLDVPTVRERALRFTVEQYHLLGEAGLIPEKVELLDGVIVEKTPKSPIHAYATEKISSLLRAVVPSGISYVRNSPSLAGTPNRSRTWLWCSGCRTIIFAATPSPPGL